jgi:hypothetical protein
MILCARSLASCLIGCSHRAREVNSLPATLCPSANEIGRIFGLEDVVLSGGKFDDADGIICRYGPAGESPPSLSESGVAMPSESFKASVLQARPDSPSAQSTERLSNSLMAASEPIELGLSGEAEVRARYLRERHAAWLIAKSPEMFTFVQVQVPPSYAFSRDQAAQHLRSVAALLGLSR